MRKIKLPTFFSKVKTLRVFSLLFIVTAVSTGYLLEANNGQTAEVLKQEKQELTQEMEQVDVPIVVAVKFKIKPEFRAEFLELATAAISPSRAEEGTISYNFYEDPNDPNSFIYFEEWKSREALYEHLEQDYTKRLLTRFPEMLDGESDPKVYEINKISYELRPMM